jgi:hypothetical protein
VVALAKMPTTRSKTKKKPNPKKELDRVFSLYIRQSYADSNGYVQCYTCNAQKHWKDMHCGHFVSRSHLATRFDEDNVRPQCVGCNIFGGGKVVIFGSKLEAELGVGTIARLYRQAQQITKGFPYAEKIAHYKALLQDLDGLETS